MRPVTRRVAPEAYLPTFDGRRPRAWAADFLLAAARWRRVGDRGRAIRDCVERAAKARQADEQYVRMMARNGVRVFRP